MRNLVLCACLLLAPTLVLAQTTAQTTAPAGVTAPTQQPTLQLPGILARYNTTLYGFVELDVDEDSTQSFTSNPDLLGNSNIARDGTYASTHPSLVFSPRNSRFGLRIDAPKEDAIKASALAEIDFFGNQTSGYSSGNPSESTIFGSAMPRIRHMYLKLETPVVNLLAGQTWEVFGNQPYFHPNTVLLQGVPGQIYSRTPQVRLSKTLKSDVINFDIVAAALRSPQRDSGVPDGQAAIKFSFPQWKGVRTTGGTGTGVDSLAVGASGIVREFQTVDSATATSPVKTVTGQGASFDAFIPVIPGTMKDRGNSLTLTGSYVSARGIADQYTGLSGGIGAPPSSGNSGSVDKGFVTFDSTGNLHAIEWQSWMAGLQYYLPGSGKVWIEGNISSMNSNNIEKYGAAATGVFNRSMWYEGGLFWDITDAVRVAAAYDRIQQTYADTQKVKNNHEQLSFWYLF